MRDRRESGTNLKVAADLACSETARNKQVSEILPQKGPVDPGSATDSDSAGEDPLASSASADVEELPVGQDVETQDSDAVGQTTCVGIFFLG